MIQFQKIDFGKFDSIEKRILETSKISESQKWIQLKNIQSIRCGAPEKSKWFNLFLYLNGSHWKNHVTSAK